MSPANTLDLQLRRKAYAGRTVLAGLRLRLAPGEVLSLVGASGCGKSTLLRIAAGLDEDFEGQVLRHGELGVVFQEPRLFPWLDAARNVGFDSAPFDAARAAALLAEVGLAGREQAWPKQLSGGQAQRVAIARALYTRPRLLLLDEPFSALDAFTRGRLQQLVVALARRHGCAVLMVTHELDEALRLSDRVLLIDGGRIARQFELSPDERGDEALRAGLRRELEAALAPA